MYKFKVGDKGKTRDGRDYEVILVEPRAERPVVALKDGWLCTRYSDGRFWNVGDDDSDLLPPERYIYVNVYKGNAYVYSNEAEAKSRATTKAFAVAIPVKIPNEQENSNDC